MSTSASIDISVYEKNNHTFSYKEILSLLIDNGWTFQFEGKVEYLPLGDKDDYNWQAEEMSVNELFKIVDQKEKAQERIGVVLTWEDTGIGGHLLIFPDYKISFNILIYRKRLCGNITDVSWYLERILPYLETEYMSVEHFSFDQC